MAKTTKQNRSSTKNYWRSPQQIAGLQTLLNQFYENVSKGFSDENDYNWVEAGLSLKRLGGFLHREEMDILADAWARSYVNTDTEWLKSTVDSIRSRL